MNSSDILKEYKEGKLGEEQALELLNKIKYEDLGYAKVDYDRETRVGYPEVIFCEGKQNSQITGIVSNMLLKSSKNILCTRVSKEAFQAVLEADPTAEYNELARIAVINRQKGVMASGKIVVATGGTADIPVAEEAALTAEVFGNEVIRVYDVGVAGIHRLLSKVDVLRRANVVIAIAGMEGALPSVIAGLISKPVIAVPTSVGYGANFKGLSALLTMINSCAAGIGVVNIDNGFGAGYLASSINRLGGLR